jgi:hypothetical protein
MDIIIDKNLEGKEYNVCNYTIIDTNNACPHCYKKVSGFHECNMVVAQWQESCGCSLSQKFGFKTLTSVYRESWTESVVCDFHDFQGSFKRKRRHSL